MEEGQIKERKRTSNKNIEKLIAFAAQYKYGIAMWRLPHAETTHLIIDTNGFKELSEISLEELSKGFLFCPYEDGKRVFLRGDIHFSSKKGEVEFSSTVAGDIIESFQSFEGSQSQQWGDSTTVPSSTNGFVSIVQKVLHEISQGTFEKVVPSRIKTVGLPDDFDVLNNFEKLTSTYPRAFIYFASIPSIGSWMGATPESLIEIENGRLFRTMSLAGTQKYHPGIDVGDVPWTQKDIEEQAMVSRYIINCFKKIRLREFTEHGPKTVIAGNLMHLKTTYEVDMIETGFSNLGTVMLDLLHPTSAVCGMPKEPAAKFIAENEVHARKYYSGFIGPVNNSQETHLFVNLRCMEIFKGHAVLYAGAGITEDSNPEKEWQETEMKFNTLLNVIDVIRSEE